MDKPAPTFNTKSYLQIFFSPLFDFHSNRVLIQGMMHGSINVEDIRVSLPPLSYESDSIDNVSNAISEAPLSHYSSIGSPKDSTPAPARSSRKSCEKLTVNDVFGSDGSISTFDSVELQEIDNIEKKGLAENLEVKNTLRYPHISHVTNGTSVEHMVIE